MLTKRRFPIAASLCGVLLIVGAAGAQEYKIKLTHAEKVGDTTPISSKGSESTTMTVTIPNQPPHQTNQSAAAELTGTRNVLAVDDKGRATKYSVTVATCTADGKSIVDPGGIIGVERTGAAATTYTVNDKPADPAVGRMLALVLTNSDPTGPDDDTSFGTSQAQKVGGSWPVNVDAAAKSATQAGLPLQKENLSGTTKLTGVDKIDGKDVLQIACNLKAKEIKGTIKGLTIQNGDMSAEMSGTFTADDSALPLTLSQTANVTLSGSANAPDGSVISLEMKLVSTTKTSTGAAAKPANAGK